MSELKCYQNIKKTGRIDQDNHIYYVNKRAYLYFVHA
jgi:hypothetical protein